jgi:hypothetical protein
MSGEGLYKFGTPIGYLFVLIIFCLIFTVCVVVPAGAVYYIVNVESPSSSSSYEVPESYEKPSSSDILEEEFEGW